MTVVGSGALVCVRLDQSDSAGSALVCACVCLCFAAISCVSDHDTVVSPTSHHLCNSYQSLTDRLAWSRDLSERE